MERNLAAMMEKMNEMMSFYRERVTDRPHFPVGDSKRKKRKP